MLEQLASIIILIIEKTGYLGIFILMAIESACIPLPSEVTMPFAGFLVSQGKMNLWFAGLAGGLGNLAGSLLAFFIGVWGGEIVIRNIIRKYGKYILISEHEFDRSEKWFNKYGEIIVFVSRLLPVVRTFISLPAGIAKMNVFKFIIYSVIGAVIWSTFLAYIGMVLGNNWEILGGYFHKFDVLIIILFIILVSLYLYHKIKLIRKID